MPRMFFFLIAFCIVCLAHLYLARRLFIASTAFPTWLRRGGSAAIMLAGALTLMVLILPRAQIHWLDVTWVQWSGYVWLGCFSLLMTLTILRDTGWGIWRIIDRLRRPSKAAVSGSETPPAAFAGDTTMSRRHLFLSASSATVLAGAASGTAIGYKQARDLARVKRTEIKVVGLPEALDGFRIVQISDLHVGPTIRKDFLQAVVDRVNELDADLIAITGDLVDGVPGKMRAEITPLGELRATHGSFYVTGNHEYYWGAAEWVEEVRQLGVVPLVNAHRVIAHKGASLVVAGATDYSAKRMLPEHASDPVAALRDAPASADFKLLLAHQPKSIYAASEAGADLQLSGHTHGGQFYPWNIVVGLAHPFSVGLGLYEKTQIYVSRGTGYWGPPLRLGAPSEISELILRRA